MQTLFYIILIAILALLGAGVGYLMNYLRGFLGGPEQLIEGGFLSQTLNDAMSPHDLMFEEHVVGAKWTKEGYWDSLNNRNLLYYVISGFLVPLIAGVILWSSRFQIVAITCKMLTSWGLHPPLC